MNVRLQKCFIWIPARPKMVPLGMPTKSGNVCLNGDEYNMWGREGSVIPHWATIDTHYHCHCSLFLPCLDSLSGILFSLDWMWKHDHHQPEIWNWESQKEGKCKWKLLALGNGPPGCEEGAKVRERADPFPDPTWPSGFNGSGTRCFQSFGFVWIQRVSFLLSIITDAWFGEEEMRREKGKKMIY